MKMMFFHGLESGPHGRKYQALKVEFPHIVSPDFRCLETIEERVAHAIALTEGDTDLVIVGSSFGGLCAAILADRHPERVSSLVLCAPALHREEAQDLSVPAGTVIIHGTLDDVVPIEASRAWAKHRKVYLAEVVDDHRLEESRDLVVRLTRERVRATSV